MGLIPSASSTTEGMGPGVRRDDVERVCGLVSHAEAWQIEGSPFLK
jgi:hypothetical protein